MSGSVGGRSPESFLSRLVLDRSPPTTPRLLALGFSVVLIGASLRVFLHVADVAGGVRWLAAGVVAALVLATVADQLTSARGCLLVGGVLLAGGVGAYLALVPELHGDLLTVGFAQRWLEYLTGVTVLDFRRAGLWAAVVAPGPVFLTWAMVLRRRYDAAVLVGGLMLGFFALTGDAGPTITLVGMAGALGVLGAGTVDRERAAVGEVARVGLLLAAAVVVARGLRFVPAGGAVEVGDSGGGRGDSDGGEDAPPFEGDVDNADERAHIYGSISLSPRVLLTVESAEAANWRVAAYDRYTGDDWVRTGGARDYEGPLSPPAGPSRRVEQTYEIETLVRMFPAAWKPTAIDDVDPRRVEVSDLDGLLPASTLLAGDTYRVTSEVPVRVPERLRAAGADYPAAVRERYLQLPGSTADRVVALASDLAGDAETPFDAAVAIEGWLEAQKDYDLGVDRPDGDVVESFLFEMPAGYCVYFASAMTVLLRAVDVPARFVIGFTPGQRVAENRWVVRGLDSHAWVEAFFPGSGWIQFDPTPSAGRRVDRRRFLARARADDVSGVDTNESRAALAEASSADLEAFAGTPSETANRTSPGGNESGSDSTPVAPTGGLGDSTGSAGQTRAPTPLDAAGDWLSDRDRLSVLAGAVGVTLGLHWVGAVDRATDEVRLRWQRPTDSPRRDVERAYERLELLLARRYRPRKATETRRVYLREAGSAVEADHARRVLDLSERASYGGVVTRAEADEAIRIVDGLVDGRGDDDG